MDKQQRTGELEKDDGARLFCRLAHLVLPYLEPAGLASISATCKVLHVVSKAITSTRISDASRYLENYPIPFFNSVDSELYANFIYSPVQTLSTSRSFSSGSGRVRPDPFLVRVEGAYGCDCESCDLDSGSNCPCPCMDCSELPTRECGPSCGCGLECGNRLTQKGISVKLKVVKDRRKGWSLCATEFIPKGKFICEYTGELLTTEEARNRQRLYDKISKSSHFSPALLVLKEHLPSGNACMRINIDATRIGNIARFINHSCDGGNLCTLIVRSSGALLPRVCFFSSRVILENGELAFSYGDTTVNSTGSQCFCNSACCRGILPAEHT